MTISLVCIVSAGNKTFADSAAAAFGYGPGNFSVPLSSTGLFPPTHWCLHTWGSENFIAMLDAAQAGQLSPLPAGIDAVALQTLLSNMTRSVRPVDANPRWHCDDVLAAQGLKQATASSS